MGYCPYSVLGRDTAGGVATGTSGEWRVHDRRVWAHGRAAACVAARVTTLVHAQDTNAERAIWFFLAPGHDINSGVVTWLGLGLGPGWSLVGT